MTDDAAEPFIPCLEMQLPEDQQPLAAALATVQNPANAPPMALFAASGMVLPPNFIAMTTSRYWGSGGVDLTVGFMEQTPNDLADKIVAHLNRWSPHCNVKFRRTQTDPQVRITREGQGYWSYLGTDILSIPRNQPTMCLQGFTMQTRDSEFIRVVTHEAGHTLGCPHEHMRRQIVAQIDRAKAIAYFWQTQRWNAQMVQQQVLTPLEEKSIMGTPTADEASIMCYSLPGSITLTGKPIIGGSDMTTLDKEFMNKMYPRAAEPPPPVKPPEPPAPPVAPEADVAFVMNFAMKQMLVRLPAGWVVNKMS